jgi:steroid delta-isomerase-like uncharacterized protein
MLEVFMSEQKTHVLRSWFEEVWNKAREEAIDELAAPGVVAYGLVDARGQHVAGREKFKEFWRGFRDAFPDIRVEVDEALADGDKEIVRCTAQGTHRGAGLGLAATEKPIKFTGMVIARIEKGQLVEVWENWDFLGLYQQIGAVPTPLV